MKIVVIGCTHISTAAVKNILRSHPEAEVIIHEGNDNISFLSCGITLYVGEVVKGPVGLLYSDPEELSSLEATAKMKHDITDVDTENKTVTVKDPRTGGTETASYNKLVMTTGSRPIISPTSGIDAKNVLLCKNYNQANEIIAQAKRAERVVIVDGGYISIELVEAFVESGKQATLIDGLDRTLNEYLDKPFTDILERELTGHGVALALGENIAGSITDEGGRAKQVAAPTGTFNMDMTILCVGFRPNTELIERKVGTLPNRAVKVNECMQTSNPDIFAAGDSAIVDYNPSSIQSYIPLATNAIHRDLLVGSNLADHKMMYHGTQGTSGLYLFGWMIGSTGMTEENAVLNGLEVQAITSEDNYRPELVPATEEVMMELVYEKGISRIVGAQFMSKYSTTQSTNTASLTAQNKMTVEDLALPDFFFQPYSNHLWNYLNLPTQAAPNEIEAAQ